MRKPFLSADKILFRNTPRPTSMMEAMTCVITHVVVQLLPSCEVLETFLDPTTGLTVYCLLGALRAVVARAERLGVCHRLVLVVGIVFWREVYGHAVTISRSRKRSKAFSVKYLSGDSNPGPHGYEPCALAI